MSLNTKQVNDAELNKDPYSGLARDIDIAYNFDWMLLFTRAELNNTIYSDKLFRFIHSIREDVIEKVGLKSFDMPDYENKRKSYIVFYDDFMKNYRQNTIAPDDLIYKVETIVRAIVLIQMTYTSFVNKDYYISLWFYDGYKSCLSNLQLYDGFTEKEVASKSWHRKERGKNIAQYELMDKGVSIALSVLNSDKEKNLTSTDIATIVRNCLKSVQDKKVPDVKQIRENWLTDKRFDDRKKKGRPKGKAEDKAKLRDKITENIINNYQHSVG